MEAKVFLKSFSTLLKTFARRSDKGWIFDGNDLDECKIGIVVFRSRWGPHYKFMLKVFIDKVFEQRISEPIDLRQVGDVFRGELPSQFDILDLESKLSDEQRRVGLKKIVELDIQPFVEKARTIEGVLDMAENKQICLLPAVQLEIWRILSERERALPGAG